MKAPCSRLRKRLAAWAQALRQEVYALYLACRDPRVPWYAKAFTAFVVGYALSPVDLIPDFIPVLGYLDDLILVPLGIYLALKLIPDPVMQSCRSRAKILLARGRPRNRIAAAVIVGLWGLAAATVIYMFMLN